MRPLAETPDMGAFRDYNNPQYRGMRMWPVPGFGKYLIFYWNSDTENRDFTCSARGQDLDGIFARTMKRHNRNHFDPPGQCVEGKAMFGLFA